MKVSELNKLIENIVSEEIKSTILKESEGGKYEVYHIKCEGEPIATFKTKMRLKKNYLSTKNLMTENLLLRNQFTNHIVI